MSRYLLVDFGFKFGFNAKFVLKVCFSSSV